MKKILLACTMLAATLNIACAGTGGEEKKGAAATEEIQWLTFEQAEQKMKEQPKKVIIDLYTSWCGWCKVMDKKTYASPALAKYVNEHYYAIKFNAEQKDPVTFMGKQFQYKAASKAHELAVQLMQGRMSYPTTIFMDENFQNPVQQPGYLELPVMEGILKYMGGNHNKTTPWNEFQKGFKAEWTL